MIKTMIWLALAGLGLTAAVMYSSSQTEGITWEKVKADLQSIEWKDVKAKLESISSAGRALLSKDADPNSELTAWGPTAVFSSTSTSDWKEEYKKGLREGFTEGYNQGYEDGLAKATALAKASAPAQTPPPAAAVLEDGPAKALTRVSAPNPSPEANIPIASAKPLSSFSQIPSWGYADSKSSTRTESVQWTASISSVETEDTDAETVKSPPSSKNSSSSRHSSRMRSSRSSSDCRT